MHNGFAGTRGGARGRLVVELARRGLGAALVLLVGACGADRGPGDQGKPGAGGEPVPDHAPQPGDSGLPGSNPGDGLTPRPGDGTNPADNGIALWSELCAGCHGDFAPGAALSSGNDNGDFRLDVAAAIERHGDGLEGYIDMAMPMGMPTLCTGACADALGAYLRSLQPPGAVGCAGGAGPALGARQVTLLASGEYQHALEDLLGVPEQFGERVANHDGRKGGFIDMAGKSVSSTLLDTYARNAESVAKWAVANNRPFACDDSAACAQRFVDEFLFQAFRGPVSDAQQAAYRELFEDYPDQGLELALKAALTSPLFLYRVEVGIGVAEARAAGYYDPDQAEEPTVPEVDAPVGGEAATGQPVEVTTADAFGSDSSGRLDGNVWMLDQNGTIRIAFSTPLTDPAVVELMARGSNYGDQWPALSLRVNGSVVGTQSVDSAEVLAYRFDVTGAAGATTLEVVFDNDAGEDPYGPGQDVNLFVQEARLFSAGGGTDPVDDSDPAPDPAPTPAPGSGSGTGLLDNVDGDAFVLTPFELASTLAFRLTGTTPDRELLDAARRGRLATRADVRAQVERLVDSERGRERMGAFVTRWFRLDELEQVSRPDVPELTDAVKSAMLEEVKTHFLHVFYDESVPYSEFFGGDYTFLNQTLADFYGVSGQFGDAFEKTRVEGRGGPLASGAFMTVNAHAERTAPILRAVRSRETALCHYIDPPNSPIAGDDIDAQRAAAQERVAEQEAAAGVLSSREFYFLYTDGIDACAGCHAQIINPMFGMEDFDHVGRLRPSAGANEVIETIRGMQATVSIEGTLHGVASTSDPTTIEYAGAKDLSNQLADTQAVNECLSRKAFRFLTGATYVDRDLDAGHMETITADQRNAYSCVASRMLEVFEANQSPRAMFIELATDSLFLFRQ